MVELLFNPNGRLNRNRFWQGMTILTVASLLVAAAAWLVHESFGYLNWVLIFPYICVYGKRLHDHGSSAWWVIAVWIVSIIIQVVLWMILIFAIAPSLMTPEQSEMLQEVMELIEKNDTAEATKGIELLFLQMGGLFLRAAMVILVLVNAIMALLVGSLRTWPTENKHGPVPGTNAADNFS